MIQCCSSGLIVSPVFSFWWFLEPFLSDFLVAVLRRFSLGFGEGCMHEPFVVLFPLIPLPNLWVKGLDFGLFFGFRVRGAFGGNPSIPLDSASYGMPMRYPYYPQFLCESVEQIGISRFGFWGVDPRVAVYPESLGPDRYDRCLPPVWLV
jgi:hypothetical protein